MNLMTPLRNIALAALAVSALAACKNDGQNPIMTDDKAATLSPPGTGAGNSVTGATGGTAASPAAGNSAAVPGKVDPVTDPVTIDSSDAYGATGSGATGTTPNAGTAGNLGNTGTAGNTATPASGNTDMSGKPQANTPPSR